MTQDRQKRRAGRADARPSVSTHLAEVRWPRVLDIPHRIGAFFRPAASQSLESARTSFGSAPGRTKEFTRPAQQKN